MTGHQTPDGDIEYRFGVREKWIMGVVAMMGTLATFVSVWTQISISREDSGQNERLVNHDTRLQRLEISSEKWDGAVTKLERIDERTARTASDVQQVLRELRGVSP